MKPWTVLEASADEARDALQSPHPGARAFACHRVVELGLESGSLTEVLGDENWVVRASAVRAVGRLDTASDVVDALARLLHDPEPTVQRLAVQALGRLGERRVVPDVIAKLQGDDSDHAMRAEAVVALGAIGDASAVDALRTMLDDPGLSGAAVEALGAIGDERAVDPLVRHFVAGVDGFEEWYIVAALRSIGARKLIFDGMANHDEPEARRMLGRVAEEWWPDEDAVLAIIAQMDDPAPTVRSGAAYRLQNWKLPPHLVELVKDALRKGLEDPDEDVRHWCQETLEEWSVED